MVRQVRPRFSRQRDRGVRPCAANIYAVETKQWKSRRKGMRSDTVRVGEGLAHSEPLLEQRMDSEPPIVEVAGNDQRCIGRYFLRHEIEQPLQLAVALRFGQAEVYADDMERNRLRRHQ